MIVVDASVALKCAIPETDGAKARSLREQVLIASSLWLSEVSDVLWRHVRLKQLTRAEAKRLFLKLRRAEIEAVPVEDDAEHALEIGLEIDRPTYDCLYLALAIRQGTYLVTADARFASAVRRDGRWAADLRLLSEI